jgi:hypothetical protein
MLTIGKPNLPRTGSANTTRTIQVRVSEADRFMAAINEQFPGLVEGDKPAYACLYASQPDPKGNITIWNAKKGFHAVNLTGALTALTFE